jgi:hypothetical protein
MHLLTVWQLALQSDDIVELKKATFPHRNPELERGGVLGPDHPTNGVFHIGAVHTG